MENKCYIQTVFDNKFSKRRFIVSVSSMLLNGCFARKPLKLCYGAVTEVQTVSLNFEKSVTNFGTVLRTSVFAPSINDR